MKNQQAGKAIVILLMVLVLLFSSAFYLSARGWGNMGYGDDHSGLSVFYLGEPKYVHHSKSIREGSIGGTGHRGGGVRGGK